MRWCLASSVQVAEPWRDYRIDLGSLGTLLAHLYMVCRAQRRVDHHWPGDSSRTMADSESTAVADGARGLTCERGRGRHTGEDPNGVNLALAVGASCRGRCRDWKGVVSVVQSLDMTLGLGMRLDRCRN